MTTLQKMESVKGVKNGIKSKVLTEGINEVFSSTSELTTLT